MQQSSKTSSPLKSYGGSASNHHHHHSNLSSSNNPSHSSTTTNSSSTSPVSTATVLLRPVPGVSLNDQNCSQQETGNTNTTTVPKGVGASQNATPSQNQSHHQSAAPPPPPKSSTTGNSTTATTAQLNTTTGSTSQAYQHNVLNAGANSNTGGGSSLPGHSFLSAVSEVKNMENALLGLLAAFNSGELSAFGSGRTLETMEAIRSKQERLARLHFDLASGIEDRGGGGVKDGTSSQSEKPTSQQQQQQPGQGSQGNAQPQQPQQSSTAPWMSESDQNKLVAGLRELSVEIEKLHEHESNCNVSGGTGNKRGSCSNNTAAEEAAGTGIG